MQNRGTGAVAGVSARSLIGSLLSSPPEPKDIASGALARTAEVTLLYCAADFWFHSDPGGTEQEPLLLADKLQRNATAAAAQRYGFIYSSEISSGLATPAA